jgi:hypothetical protein
MQRCWAVGITNTGGPPPEPSNNRREAEHAARADRCFAETESRANLRWSLFFDQRAGRGGEMMDYEIEMDAPAVIRHAGINDGLNSSDPRNAVRSSRFPASPSTTDSVAAFNPDAIPEIDSSDSALSSAAPPYVMRKTRHVMSSCCRVGPTNASTDDMMRASASFAVPL